VLLLGLGVYVVYRFATHKGIIKKWEDFIEDKFGKSGMFEESDDAEDLLHLFEGYGLVKVTVDEQSSLNGHTLADCRLNMQGILVLGIEREKSWIPVPHGDAIMHAGDRLVVYGPLNEMKVVLKEAT
jgi:K+/H+ antiporter YhaU regulatory subunit KhtT